jgi:putative Mn2+ efflux pump MntP
MDIFEVLGYAIGLSADAFAVSTCKGLALKKAGVKEGVICGAWFGGFQGLMPMIGFFLATLFGKAIQSIAPFVAFGLLALIGGNMLKEAFEKDCECCENTSADLGFRTMLAMAVATSIDAMAAGVSLGLDRVNIWVYAPCIAVATFLLSAVGVKVGSVFGSRFEKKAQLAGGIILVLLGVKILLEHFFA